MKGALTILGLECVGVGGYFPLSLCEGQTLLDLFFFFNFILAVRALRCGAWASLVVVLGL